MEQERELLKKEKELKQKRINLDFEQNNETIISLSNPIEKVKTYEEAFAKIKEVTQTETLEEIMKTFIKKEEYNQSLFNYVNELAEENESMESRINVVKNEIKSYSGNREMKYADTIKYCEDQSERIEKLK